MHKHLSNYFPWKTRVGKINQYWTNAIPVTKGPGYIGIHSGEKRKGGLVITELKNFSKTKKSKQETQKSQQNKEWLSFDRDQLSQICIFIRFKVLWLLLWLWIKFQNWVQLLFCPLLIYSCSCFRPLTTLLAILSSNLATFTSHESLEAFPKQIHS